MPSAIALFLLLLGCPSDSDEPVVESDTDSDTDADTDSDADTDTDTDPAPSDLPAACLDVGCDIAAVEAAAQTRCEDAVAGLGGDPLAVSMAYREDSSTLLATHYTRSLSCRSADFEGQPAACDAFCAGYAVATIPFDTSVSPPVADCATWWAASGCPETQSGRTCSTAESDSVMTWHSSASTVTTSR